MWFAFLKIDFKEHDFCRSSSTNLYVNLFDVFIWKAERHKEVSHLPDRSPKPAAPRVRQGQSWEISQVHDIPICLSHRLLLKRMCVSQQLESGVDLARHTIVGCVCHKLLVNCRANCPNLALCSYAG